MSKRGGKKHPKVRKEVDSFLYERERKAIDSFLEEKEIKKNDINKEKKVMKFGKGDLIFVIVYFLIYFLLLITLLIITPLNLDAPYEEIILWDKLSWVLLYTIGVPILYLLIRSSYKKKKRN
ncbi:MAG: hypothetical protein JSW60_04805 [Thermoplasmatales archaeon]|nr:MAG: hypothetical protein JSW60_04805 [Thermoplasmatales archaeon]